MPSSTPFNFEKPQVEHALAVLTNGTLMLDKAPFPDEGRPFTKLCQDWLGQDALIDHLQDVLVQQVKRADAERDSASRATEEMILLARNAREKYMRVEALKKALTTALAMAQRLPDQDKAEEAITLQGLRDGIRKALEETA